MNAILREMNIKSHNTYAIVADSHKKQMSILYMYYEVIYMDLRQLIERLKQLSDIFYDNGIEDIYTNSKIYEVLMSEQFGHKIINGHANTLDAVDTEGNLYEYKHFKLSSTNHTWTFNDFSDATIAKL